MYYIMIILIIVLVNIGELYYLSWGGAVSCCACTLCCCVLFALLYCGGGYTLYICGVGRLSRLLVGGCIFVLCIYILVMLLCGYCLACWCYCGCWGVVYVFRIVSYWVLFVFDSLLQCLGWCGIVSYIL